MTSSSGLGLRSSVSMVKSFYLWSAFICSALCSSKSLKVLETMTPLIAGRGGIAVPCHDLLLNPTTPRESGRRIISTA